MEIFLFPCKKWNSTAFQLYKVKTPVTAPRILSDRRHLTTKETIYTLMPFTIYGVICRIVVVVPILETTTWTENDCFCFFGVLANSFDLWLGEIISGIGFGLEEGEIERRSVPSEISDNLRHFSRRTLVYVIKRPPPVRIDLAFWRMSEGGAGFR